MPRMALAHKVVITALFNLIFLIFVGLKLDHKVDWNWFVVFIPLWVFDVMLLAVLILRVVSHCRIGTEMQNDTTLWGKLWYLSVIFLKFTFQIMICVRLQVLTALPLYYVMIPIWLFFSSSVVRLFPWSSRFR